MSTWSISVARNLLEGYCSEESDGKPRGVILLKIRQEKYGRQKPELVPDYVKKFLGMRQIDVHWYLVGLTAPDLEMLLSQPYGPVLRYKKRQLFYHFFIEISSKEGTEPWITRLPRIK